MRVLLLSLCLAAPAAHAETPAPVGGIVLSPVRTLSRNPTTLAPESCARIAPQTPEGQSVAAQGWAVTSELTRSAQVLVTFAGQDASGAQPGCTLTDGNLAVFRAGALEAIGYSPDRQSLIGAVRAFDTAGARLWSGDTPAAPLADLELTASGARLLPLAATETVCGGPVVPAIHNQPITAARTALQANGWAPKLNPAPSQALADLVATGLPEVEDCAGTGMGYCNFLYTHSAGAALSVTTIDAGDSPPVVISYDATCPQG